MKIFKSNVTSSLGDITVYEVVNNNGASIKVSSLGAGIISINVPDRYGAIDDVVIGYLNISDYIKDSLCAGKTVGRYANRISKGQFRIEDRTYQLSLNDYPNAIHGGAIGFANQIWNSEIDNESIVFTLHSKDGDDNYPGNVDVVVKYLWNNNNELIIEYDAECDQTTILNLTNHAYFNLSGESSGTVLNHTLQLFSSCYLPTDSAFIPTGEYHLVENTPMDFRVPMKIGDGMKIEFEALKYGKGYNHCWVADDMEINKLKMIAILSDENTGRILEVETTQPTVQVYPGNFMAGSPISKSGRAYNDYDGIAIECQGMPDAPNHPNFPSQLLHKNEKYHHIIKYKFLT